MRPPPVVARHPDRPVKPGPGAVDPREIEGILEPFKVELIDQICCLGRFWGPAALVQSTQMQYFFEIEFRPNDLASPRVMRRTDDLPPNLDQSTGRANCA